MWKRLKLPYERCVSFLEWVRLVLVHRGVDGLCGALMSLMEDAHQGGLLAHSYTAQPENICLPWQLRRSEALVERSPLGMMAEVQRYLTLGLDGFFIDNPALGRKAVDGV